MGRNIVTTVGQRPATPSLSPRLVVLATAVGTVQHPGQRLRYNLPQGWGMSAKERAEAERTLSSLTSSLDPDAPFEVEPGRFEPGLMAKGALLTKLINGLAGPAAPSEVAAASKIEMYADAIQDVPAWAIDRAIRRWARGACPPDIEERPKFAFPPAPATLRALALLETSDARRDAKLLTNLLAAEPVEAAMDPTARPSTAVASLRRM